MAGDTSLGKFRSRLLSGAISRSNYEACREAYRPQEAFKSRSSPPLTPVYAVKSLERNERSISRTFYRIPAVEKSARSAQSTNRVRMITEQGRKKRRKSSGTRQAKLFIEQRESDKQPVSTTGRERNSARCSLRHTKATISFLLNSPPLSGF